MATTNNTTYQTVINHEARTITTYEVTPEVVESVKEMLSMFTSKEEPVYSLGFQRWEKLSKARKNLETKRMYIAGIGVNDMYNNLHARLEAMTEAEFKAFKKEK